MTIGQVWFTGMLCEGPVQGACEVLTPGRLEPALPRRLDVADLPDGAAHELAALPGEADQAGPSVGGIGAPFQVAPSLEDGHELSHRLMGHPCPGGEVREAGAARVDVLEHRVVRGGHVREPRGCEPLDELVDHRPAQLADQADDGDQGPAVLAVCGFRLDKSCRHPA